MHASTTVWRRGSLAVLLFVCGTLASPSAPARPVVLQEVARLTSPDPALRMTGAVALDGNDLLVVASEPLDGTEGQRAVLYHFERGSDGSWLPRGPIFSAVYDEAARRDVVLRNGLGMVLVGLADGEFALLERTGTGWKITRASSSNPLLGRIREVRIAAVHGQTIAVGADDSALGGVLHLLEKNTAGTWAITHTFEAPEDADDGFVGPDIAFAGDEAFADADGLAMAGETSVFDRIGGTWQQTATLHPRVRTRWQTIVVDDSIAVRRNNWTQPGDVLSFYTRLAPGEAFTVKYSLLTAEWFADKRPGAVIVEGNLAYAATGSDDTRGRDAGSIAVYSRTAPRRFEHTVTLVASDASAGATLGVASDPRTGATFGPNIAASGRRVAALGLSPPDANGSRTETIYVFELPAPLPAVARVQDTFEDLNSAGWTPWGFTNWRVVSSGRTHVFRQTNTQGDARAIFEDFQGGNQSIQADLKLNAFAATGTHWAGLMARYTDSKNFYYLMQEANTLQIRKIVNGVFTPIASTPFTLQVGRKYRVRLEAVGTWLRAYVNDRLMLTARDTAHSSGRTGLAMWKANAEYDNVVITSSPYTTLHADSFDGTDDEKVTPAWVTLPANAWARITTGTGAQVFKQSVANGNARAVHGAPTDDQIVTADIRPTTFHASGGWAGLMVRHVNTSTYYYAFLHSSGQVSLRRWMNGQVTVLNEVPFTVTAGTSYRMRLEAIGSTLRVYVNGQFMAEAVDSAIPQGRYGLVTYRAAAEFDNFNASRP